VAAGAVEGGSPAGVAARAEIVLTCLPDTATVQAVVGGEQGLLGQLGRGGKICHQVKDLRIILDAARAYGAPLPATSLVHELYSSMLANGQRDLDHAALVLLLEQLAGAEVRPAQGGGA